ncbi:hypothetical protein JIG36_24810 [Actinoplanes sp. LDG1-06]|uniref:Uncharacterized protein n=1 Tax=Paractinoplanes ovalisporus TaxID=2810368 RepID=A0ABS2AHS2_9ACTN|nr:hypothetical protein [Actinoplanes ovalisporus]MBM2618784.1 hypothetical protein [Actinoplanes ovalisporus]
MPRRFCAAVLALTTLASVTSCSWFYDDGHEVSRSGGSVSSGDGKVRVTFTSGQLSENTKVTIAQDEEGPAPVPGFVPLNRPFDVALDHPARGGTVTVSYRPPSGVTVDPSRVAMFIEENGSWVLVPAIVDPAKHTVSGSWPHFSKGHVAFFNPLAAAGDAAAWSWDKVKDGGGWLVDRSGDVVKGIAAGAVGLTGGTTDTARCVSKAKEWTVKNSTGMTGCVSARDEHGMWPARVNDRYPYPLVVDLPDGADRSAPSSSSRRSTTTSPATRSRTRSSCSTVLSAPAVQPTTF